MTTSKSSNKKIVAAIVAMTDDRVVGKDGDIPWHLPEDQKRFAKLTKGNTVLMGRKTYESIPDKYRPLKQRKNVLVTRNSNWKSEEDVEVMVCSPVRAVEKLLSRENLPGDTIWVIGGEEIWRSTLPRLDMVYLTKVHLKAEGDCFMPAFEDDFKEIFREEHEEFTYINYKRGA